MTAAENTEQILREFALEYPEAHEDFPWGSRVIKVRGKIFFTVNSTEEGLVVTMKLPESGKAALKMDNAEPTHYGMGKHGWVTVRFDVDEEPDMDLLTGWMDESYRVIALKRLVKELDAQEE
jgi:predicted DNA-binding protein (MmcQ/YjbR family)